MAGEGWKREGGRYGGVAVAGEREMGGGGAGRERDGEWQGAGGIEMGSGRGQRREMGE